MARKSVGYIKNCLFCWEHKSTMDLTERVNVAYGPRVYNAHKDCTDLWEVCQEAIIKKTLNSSSRGSNLQITAACNFVERFFRIMMRVDKKTLISQGVYYKYYD